MNDWIKWNGGKCPVPIGTLVDVEHRDGSVHKLQRACVLATGWAAKDWSHDAIPCVGDIVAYRLSQLDS